MNYSNPICKNIFVVYDDVIQILIDLNYDLLDSAEVGTQLAADIVFHSCLNFVGW